MGGGGGHQGQDSLHGCNHLPLDLRSVPIWDPRAALREHRKNEEGGAGDRSSRKDMAGPHLVGLGRLAGLERRQEAHHQHLETKADTLPVCNHQVRDEAQHCGPDKRVAGPQGDAQHGLQEGLVAARGHGGAAGRHGSKETCKFLRCSVICPGLALCLLQPLHEAAGTGRGGLGR